MLALIAALTFVSSAIASSGHASSRSLNAAAHQASSALHKRAFSIEAGFTPSDECADSCGVFGAVDSAPNATFLCSTGGFSTIEACGECNPDLASQLGVSNVSNDTMNVVHAYEQYCVIHEMYTPPSSCTASCELLRTDIKSDCANPNADGFCGPCTEASLINFRICSSCDPTYIGAYYGTNVTSAISNLVSWCPIDIAKSSSSSSTATSSSAASKSSSASTSASASRSASASVGASTVGAASHGVQTAGAAFSSVSVLALVVAGLAVVV